MQLHVHMSCFLLTACDSHLEFTHVHVDSSKLLVHSQCPYGLKACSSAVWLNMASGHVSEDVHLKTLILGRHSLSDMYLKDSRQRPCLHAK